MCGLLNLCEFHELCLIVLVAFSCIDITAVVVYWPGWGGRYDGATMGDGGDTNRIRECSQNCAGKSFLEIFGGRFFCPLLRQPKLC